MITKKIRRVTFHKVSMSMSKCLTCQIGHNCLDCHFITLVIHPYLLFNHHNNKIPSSIFPLTLTPPSYFLFLKTLHITSDGSVLSWVWCIGYYLSLVFCLLPLAETDKLNAAAVRRAELLLLPPAGWLGLR